MQVEESLSLSFGETNVDQTGLNALDNSPSSLAELVNGIDYLVCSNSILLQCTQFHSNKQVVSSGFAVSRMH